MRMSVDSHWPSEAALPTEECNADPWNATLDSSHDVEPWPHYLFLGIANNLGQGKAGSGHGRRGSPI